MSRARIEHQPALDGVRALSVVAVLCFHGEVAGFGGGYLGVSVFFTLSGFLITSLLLAEHAAADDVTGRTGRIDVAGFYVRRAKRLLPASLACLLGVAVVAATTDWFDAVSTLRRDLLGSLFQVANWVFLAGNGSYQQLFAKAGGQASPFEHYWSLAIEEQFYWVWPLAFVALCRAARTHRSRTAVLAGITVLFAAAAPAVAAVWGGDAAYWATPARAAEILVGALVAFVVRGRRLPQRTWLLAPAALTVLAACVVLFPGSGGPAFHGALPLVGVVSAALVLGLQVPSPVTRALSIGPLTWLGRISYGVYLYHWPVFVLVDGPRLDLTEPWRFALRMAITIALAQASFVLLERPIRVGLRWRPAAIAAVAGVATASVAVAAVVLVPAGRGEYWRTAQAAALDAAIEPVDVDGTLAPLVAATSTTVVPTTVATTAPADSGGSTTSTSSTTSTVAPLPALARPVRIVVAGDSTAEATGLGLAQWALERPDLAQVTIEAAEGCGFVRGGELFVQDWQPFDRRCERWLDRDLVDRVRELRPDVVMLMTTSWDVLDRRWNPDERLTPLDPTFADHIRLDFTVITDQLLDAGAARVVWVRQLVPDVFWWHSGQSQEDPARHQVLYDMMDDLAATHPGQVGVVDLAGWAATQGLDLDQEARPDGVHWSAEAAGRVAREFLGEALVRSALGL